MEQYYKIAVLAFLLLPGCGDGDRDTKTITVNDTGGDVSINESAPQESKDTVLDSCFRCIGNPNDGVTDEQCLAVSGVTPGECV